MLHALRTKADASGPVEGATSKVMTTVLSLEKIYRIAIEIEDKVEKTIAVLLQSDAQMKVIVAH